MPITQVLEYPPPSLYEQELFLLKRETPGTGTSNEPLLEYPPPDLSSIPASNTRSTLKFTDEDVIGIMDNPISSFTQRAHSDAYYTLLQKRKQLPVFSHLRRFCKLFCKRQVIIVTGETGCGKTTQIPQYVACGDLPHVKGKVIAVTQPRRVTTVSVASRVASEMDVELGKEVGYSIRFDEKTAPGTTFLRYMTDGKLLHEAMYDPEFHRYSTIIIDEAHERTIATDILMVLLKAIAKRRSDLKIIIMSATLDAPMFRSYFSLDDGVTPAALLHIPGRSYPVEIRHVKNALDDYVKKAIEVVLHTHEGNDPGDILLFLTGQDEIETTCKRVSNAVNLRREKDPKIGPLDCIPLYSMLPQEKQQRIFDPPPVNQTPGGQPGRKLVVATNIAETSLTIDGIYFVVDCGVAKHKVHHPRLKMEYLRVMKISKASAQQRAGRAGRTGPGTCYRLYTEDEYEDMAEKTRPEVLNIDLSDAILKLLTIGIKVDELTDFEFIDSPAAERITSAVETLIEVHALNGEKRLTYLGRMMAEFPLNPRLSKSLIESVRLKATDHMLTMAAMLSVQNVWQRPFGEYREADMAKKKFIMKSGDHLTLWNVYNQYIKNSCSEEWAKEHYLSANSLEEAKKVREQLAEMLESRYVVQALSSGLISDVTKALLSGFYMQIAVRTGNGKYVRLKDNMEIKLHPSSVLSANDPSASWIMFDELVRNRTPFVRTASVISPQWLSEVAPEYYNPEAFSDERIKLELESARKVKRPLVTPSLDTPDPKILT